MFGALVHTLVTVQPSMFKKARAVPIASISQCGPNQAGGVPHLTLLRLHLELQPSKLKIPCILYAKGKIYHFDLQTLGKAAKNLQSRKRLRYHLSILGSCFQREDVG